MNINIKKHNLVILFVLVVATVITLFTTIKQRMEIESKNDTVEIMFDYTKLLEIEDYEKTTMGEWLKVATNDQEEKYTIAIKEEYMAQYAKENGLYYATVGTTKNSLVSGLIDEKILELINSYDEQAIIIKTARQADKEFLENGFSFYDFLNVTTYEVGSDYYFLIDHGFNDASQFDTMPLGFSNKKIKDIKDTGARLCLRPLNYTHDTEGAFNLYVSEADKHNMDSKIVFFENEVTGFERQNPESIMLAANYIRDNNLKFQVVESGKLSDNLMMEGYEELVDELGYNYIVRMFNVWDFIATRYQYLGVYKGAEEIENTIFRAVSERNNRAVVLNIIRNKDNTKFITDPTVYTEMLTNLEDRLAIQGLSYGDATTFENYHVSRTILWIMAIEVVLFVVVLLNMVFGNLSDKTNIILAIIGSVGVIGLDILSRSLFLDILSLTAGITLSTIAVLFYVKYVLWVDEDARTKKPLINIVNLFVTILIALLGGLFIASFKSRLEFLLVFETFKGVKLSLLVPIMLLFLALFIYFIKQLASLNKRSVKDQLVTTTTTFLNVNIKMYYVIIFGFVGMAGLLYLLRTGNTGATPSSFEFLIRNYFENHLFARPRNKELFIAVPMMVVGVAFIKSNLVQKNVYTKFIYIFAISMFAVIETTSIINTFSHRTPLDMSLYRTFAAVGFGVILGLVYTAIIYVFVIIIKKINEKFKLVGY